MIVVMAIGASEAEILGVKSQILSEGMSPYDHAGGGASRHRGRRRGRPRKQELPSRLAALPGVESVTADQPAVQAHLARVPPRGHGDPRARCGDRRRFVDDDGRTVLRGEPGPAVGDGRCGEGRRRDDPARRRVQAADQPVRVPGSRRRGAPLPRGGARSDRAAGDHRGDGAEPGRHRGGVRRHPPDRRPEHAELLAAAPRRAGRPAGDAQARLRGDDRGVADGRRVHRQRPAIRT